MKDHNMVSFDDNINDDELRVLGKHPSSERTKRGVRLWCYIILSALVITGIIYTVSQFLNDKPDDVSSDFYETELGDSVIVNVTEPVKTKLGNYSNIDTPYTEQLQMTINDIPLDIYIPHNAKPRLFIGTPNLNDNKIIFTTQAADIRADNGKINGAFVLAGEPKAWGLSKKGFCGILGDSITIGVAENSSLFEKATETGGYFFRQYPLVDNGRLVENEPKGKSVRKAICDRGGEIVVVMSQTKESFHDFAQALIDLGVNNAIYLVGSKSYGFFRDELGQLSVIYEKQRGGQKYENHIQWVAVDVPGSNN